MWLLNTNTAQLHYHHSPFEVRYAILSHVWSRDARLPEQTFQDVIQIHAEAAQLSFDSNTILESLSPKIRQSCIIAREDGYEWLWMDTCCINKASSAELSEAINSMFAWYAGAAVCYAFLHDVADDEDPAAADSSFRNSEWFTRGWTLQELIAPELVVFLSWRWEVIGTKDRLARVIEAITGVDVDILTRRKALDDVSIARRMSWASNRRTTRPEDEAYSLMGIFGVHMPTIYGEQRDAFIRLQEEIVRRSPDQSIFVWGLGRTLTGDVLTHSSAGYLPVEGPAQQEQSANRLLFASSPAAFQHSHDVKRLDVDHLSMRLKTRIPLPMFTLTAHGVLATLPVYKITTKDGRVIHLVALACHHASDHLSALFLQPSGTDRYLVGRMHWDATSAQAVVVRRTLLDLKALETQNYRLDLLHVCVPHRMQRTLARPPAPLWGAAEDIARKPLKITFPRWQLDGFRVEGQSSFVLGPDSTVSHTVVLVATHPQSSSNAIAVRMSVCRRGSCPYSRQVGEEGTIPLFSAMCIEVAQ